MQCLTAIYLASWEPAATLQSPRKNNSGPQAQHSLIRELNKLGGVGWQDCWHGTLGGLAVLVVWAQAGGNLSPPRQGTASWQGEMSGGIPLPRTCSGGQLTSMQHGDPSGSLNHEARHGEGWGLRLFAKACGSPGKKDDSGWHGNFPQAPFEWMGCREECIPRIFLVFPFSQLQFTSNPFALVPGMWHSKGSACFLASFLSPWPSHRIRVQQWIPERVWEGLEHGL